MKKISTLIGIIILVATTMVLFGGVLAYQYFFVKTQPIVQTQNQINQTAGWKNLEIKHGGFIFEIAVSPCEYVSGNWCYVKRTIKISDASDNKTIKEIQAKPASWLGSEPKDNMHLLFDDLNFDGTDDLIIWNETSGAYGVSDFDVYLHDGGSKNFVYNKDFSGIVSGYYPKIDKENKEIITIMKSGCCIHWTTAYKIENNIPVRIRQVTDEAGKITEGQLVDGQWVETTK